MQCLESDPKSEKVDKFGIALIIINCMSNNSRTAMYNFTNIVKNIMDKDMKMAVTEDCVGKYPEVIGNVSKVNNLLKNREFDQAVDALSNAIASEHYCYEGISKFKLVFPDLWIYYGIRVYEELSDGVMRMIDHFM
ncbi:hypothetical protein Dsin_012454 [Dipteronia sinensis]|uniref:Uncharacterized protein n=1 Tax=Dipteronia sinensis TaxID=43782 RepID=A0AAE0E867_9ROSI|nr:hypothetical protein Dsin_012454 [Dipteronia sinensis]